MIIIGIGIGFVIKIEIGAIIGIAIEIGSGIKSQQDLRS